MLTRAAYKLADAIATIALRLDRRYVRTTPTNGECFPIVSAGLAAACLLVVITGGTR